MIIYVLMTRKAKRKTKTIYDDWATIKWILEINENSTRSDISLSDGESEIEFRDDKGQYAQNDDEDNRSQHSDEQYEENKDCCSEE